MNNVETMQKLDNLEDGLERLRMQLQDLQKISTVPQQEEPETESELTLPRRDSMFY